MKLRNKKSGTGTQTAGNLYERCEHLFDDSRKAVRKDRAGCADSVLALVPSHGTDAYRLCRFRGKHPYYSIFPPGGAAGDGSFIYPDGSFTQHGAITRHAAELIITTSTPAE